MENLELRNGLIAGLLYTVFLLMLYVLDVNSLYQWPKTTLNIIFFCYVLFFVFLRRKNLGGYISFNHAFKVGFVLFLFLSVFSHSTFYALHAYVDPELNEIAKEIKIERALKFADRFGVEVDEGVRQGMEDNEYSLGITRTIIRILGYIFVCLLVTILWAFILKKEKPLHYE